MMRTLSWTVVVWSALFLAPFSNSEAQNYQPGVAPYSSTVPQRSASSYQQPWSGSGRYGGAYGTNSAYAPIAPNQSTYGGQFGHANYQQYNSNASLGSNNPGLMALTSLSGAGGSGAGMNPYSNSGPLNSLLNLFYGEGDFTSRLLHLTVQVGLLQLLGGGAAVQMMLYPNNSYTSAATNANRHPLLSAIGSNPKSLQASQNSKLNPCDAKKLKGPTTEVNDLYKQLAQILY
jgi:hypothetical protein